MEQYNVLAYTLIFITVLGALSVVLGTLGCCGSWHYSRCLLGIYFVLLLIIFAIEIALGVAGFVFDKEVSLVLISPSLSSVLLFVPNFKDQKNINQFTNNTPTEFTKLHP